MGATGAGCSQAEPSAYDDQVIVLSGRMTIGEVEALREDILRGLNGCQRLTLDTDGLETVDAAGLQLLIAARHSAMRAGKTVRLAAEPRGGLLAALVGAGFRPAGDAGPSDAGQDGFWWGRG
jgi:ABC-type transporter Mla MlaB component